MLAESLISAMQWEVILTKEKKYSFFVFLFRTIEQNNGVAEDVFNILTPAKKPTMPKSSLISNAVRIIWREFVV